MAKLFSLHGSNVFEKKTLRLLHSTEGESAILKQALVELVLDELECWDGVVSEDEEKIVGEQSIRRRIQSAGLRICMNHDPLSQEIRCYLRFKTAKPFPEEGLHFERHADKRIYSCMETFQGWSTPLKYTDKESVNRLDATSLDWVNGEDFLDKENEWRGKLRGLKTHLFRLGTDALPDWVESQMLERGIEFYITSSGSDAEKIREWGGKHCERFRELAVSGLPHGWVLFSGKNATQSCDGIDILSISSQVRIHLREGLRAGRGNTFFYFAPPKLVVENGLGDEKVVVNGRQMIRKKPSEPVWSLPDDIPIGEPLRIEVMLEKRSLSRIIRLETFGLPAPCDNTPFRNRFGDFCSHDEPSRARGVNTVDTVSNVSFPQILPVHLSNRIIFIGSRPGQIAEWPSEPIPQDWQPVWALTCKSRKQWVANFCGTMNDASVDAVPGTPLNDRKKLKMWKEALWVQRRITTAPQLHQLKLVWKKYLEAASNV